MRKNRVAILFSLLFTIIFYSNVFASNDISIFIDGQPKEFSPPPIIQNGTTLVPMRDCFETLGCRIYWHSPTRTALAVRDDVKVKVTIDKNEAFVNDNKKYLSVAPQIIGESTYVPLRFVSESLGAKVEWDNNTRTITILDKDKEEVSKYELVDTQEYEIRTTFSFYNGGDEINAEFDVLAGTVSNSPYQLDSSMDINPIPNEVYNDNYNNKYAKISRDNIKKGEEINITFTKKLENSGIKYIISNENIINEYENLDNSDIYTSPQILTESDNPEIIKKAKELAGDEENPYVIARNVFEFVNSYLTYDTSERYARKGALNALNTARGLCEDYSKLFVALMRANGIPSRSVFGYWITDETEQNITYDEWYDLKDVPHEWPEFYLRDYGWIIVEPTFIYEYNGEKAVPWEQFANQDSHGHIIYGYESNSENALKWRVEGYGKLNLQYRGMKTEIRKISTK